MATPAPSSAARPADASAFRKSFASKVEELKDADKRQITSLTILADEHRDKAAEVVEVLTRRMQQLPSGDYRLPLMYLIDSICQNLGRKGADYPKRMQPHIKPMLASMLKHCTAKVKGSLYRMFTAWKKSHTFNKDPLAEIEVLMDSYLSADERADALARPSASQGAPPPDDPRKRSAAAASASSSSPSASPSYGQEQPAAKKAKLAADPRRVAPTATVTPEATVLLQILNSADITSRVDLQPLVTSIHMQLRLPLPPEEMKALIATLVQQLTTAYAQPPPPPMVAPLPPIMPLQPPPPSMFMQPPPPPPSTALPPFGGVYQPPPPLPLQPQQPPPSSRGWTPPLPLPSSLPSNLSIMPQKSAMRAEPSRPLTFSEEDLKTRHPWLASSLYTSIPFQCKTCGRRIHSQAEMTSHLDWHFAMHKRAATIAKSQGGARWQNWYWEQEEWVQATDVIFGVQKRNAPGIGAAGATTSAATATTAVAGDKSAAVEKHPPQSVPADENQKKCMVCNEEFKTEWSNEDESWMYRDCMRVTPSFLTDVQAQIVALEAAAPTATAAAAPVDSSAQAAALASKEDDRLTQLYRCHKVVTHVQQFQGLILHQACHYGLIGQIMKSKRPADGKAEATAAETKVESDPQQMQQIAESKSAELPALE